MRLAGSQRPSVGIQLVRLDLPVTGRMVYEMHWRKFCILLGVMDEKVGREMI